MHCTAMQPRLSFLGILLYLCISHLVILAQGFSDAVVLGTICNKRQTQCTKPGDVSYPFARDGVCAVSESFGLISCSSDQPYWDAFKSAIDGVDDNLLTAPAITGIFRVDSYTYINLAWNMQYVDKTDCDSPISVDDVDDFVPNFINLTTFANGSLQFSSLKVYLLFNCTNPYSTLVPDVDKDSSICRSYQKKCSSLGTMSCVQWTPFQELAIHDALQKLSCTHFQSVVQTDSLFDSEWNTGMVQLAYGGDIRCETCFNSNGQCVYNKVTHHFETCICGENWGSQTDCHHAKAGCRGKLCSLHAKIAIGVSVTVVAILCMMLLFWIYHRKTRYSTKSFHSSSSNRLFTQRAYMLSEKFGPVATKEFSFETLSKATMSFADENMIGDGGFGAVYLGILKNGHKIAIKRLYHDNFRRMDHFYNEMKILSTLDHPHLVKLYGFCCQDSKDLLLVFEYASNGTVFDQLHDTTKPAMPWKIRLSIAQETAEALTYLHNSVTPPIYHRDVKTTNILLDDELHVKLADFGLSRLVPIEATHVSTAPQGTPGYLDPDYHQCYQLTDKSDVYSFGVVLVELVSAKLAVDMSRNRGEINLSSLALMKIGCGEWEELVDPRLEMGKNADVEIMVKRFIELAYICLNAEKDNRPTMKYVAETLASMCKEFEYGQGFSFRMDMNGLSPADDTIHLINTQPRSKSTKSRDSTQSSNWTSSTMSSHVNSL